MFVLDGGSRFVIPRTEMTFPGHNMRLYQNAADPLKAPVDLVMADFEDACPYEFKGEKSRAVAVQALNTLDFGRKVVAVRPNNLLSHFFMGDLEAVVLKAPDRFHGIVLPKVHGPDDVLHVSRVLDDLERRGGWKTRLQIECLIETPQALLRAYEIASASDRMCGLIFGIADFAASLGIREIVDDQSVNFLYAKQSMVISAKAAGLHAIDNVYTKLIRLDDSPEQKHVVEAGLREKNMQAAAIGMDGTWIVHPQQAKIANECFTPTPAQIADAKRVVELYHQKGGGSMSDPETGDMIDEATIKIALMDLAKGLQNGDVAPEYLAEQAAKSREVTGYDILNLVRRHS
jgi:citrate lyase beta subunit